jgi:hypothetical protein
VLRNVNKIDKFAARFNKFNLGYVEILREFDPNKKNLEHLQTLGFENSFFKKHLTENRYIDNNAPIFDVGDLDTLQSTTELYNQ